MAEVSELVPSRRVVCGVLLAGFAGPVVAACGSDSSTTGSTADPGDPDTTPSVPAGDAIVATKDVPVGGMALVLDPPIVVTQPEEGTFKAFSATCTHQGTILDPQFQDDALHCPKHGSEFSPTDGSVTHGPATRALPEIAVKVEGGNVVRA